MLDDGRIPETVLAVMQIWSELMPETYELL
jgi:hypothetical protein